MAKEISLADFDRHVLIAWGKKEIVVKVPAVKPIAVIESTAIYFAHKLSFDDAILAKLGTINNEKSKEII